MSIHSAGISGGPREGATTLLGGSQVRIGRSGLDEEQVSALLEHSAQPELVLLLDGRVLATNEAAASTLGVARERLIGAPLSGFLPSLSAYELHAALDTRSERALLLEDELGQALNGTLRPLSDRNGIVSAFALCLRRDQQTELRQAQGRAESTLRSMLRLTGELGHDLNNQLAAVLNYAFVVERRLSQAAAESTHLAELRAAAWRAAGLSRWLQLGARTRTPQEVSVAASLAALEPILAEVALGAPLLVRCDDPELTVEAPLSDFELLVTVLLGIAVERTAPEHAIELVAQAVDFDQVRIVCRAHGKARASSVARRSLRSHRPQAHSSIRRALRRAGAHLGHDATSVFIDFPRA
jgi:hypothetical protein